MPPTPDLYTLSLHDALPISPVQGLTLRDQLEKHRRNPVCASCHRSIDPVGFALENFDPIGRWRTEIQGKPVRSEEHTSELQSLRHLVCRLLLEKKKNTTKTS